MLLKNPMRTGSIGFIESFEACQPSVERERHRGWVEVIGIGFQFCAVHDSLVPYVG